MLFKIAPLSLNPKKTAPLSPLTLSLSPHFPLTLLSCISLSSPLLSRLSLLSRISLSLLSLSILHLSSPLNSSHNALTTQRRRRICAGKTTSFSRLHRRCSSSFWRNHIAPVCSDESTSFQNFAAFRFHTSVVVVVIRSSLVRRSTIVIL